MPLLDPEIIETRLQNIFLNQPEQIGFDYLADLILGSLTSPAQLSELICAVRVFARLQNSAYHQERCRNFYNCEAEDPELETFTRSFFTDYPPSRTGMPHTDTQNAQTLISQPLGVQKSMARSHLRGHQEALLFSPWPQVIEILCANPSIQERDIIFMASRRPTQNALLEPILKSAWSNRPEIRLALAANPYLNVSHALRCVPTLPRPDLEILASLPELHPAVSRHAQCFLNFLDHHNAPNSRHTDIPVVEIDDFPDMPEA